MTVREYQERGRKKPMVGFMPDVPPSPAAAWGHAGEIISGGTGDADSKLAAMEAAGIRVSASPVRLGTTLIYVLKG